MARVQVESNENKQGKCKFNAYNSSLVNCTHLE